MPIIQITIPQLILTIIKLNNTIIPIILITIIQ